MAVNRVFYDQKSGVVLGLHALELNVPASAYPNEGRPVASFVADAEEIPSPLVEETDPETGRLVSAKPRVLSKTWIKNHEEPLTDRIDSSKGKLALLYAEKLDDVEAAIAALKPAVEARAGRLKFDAQTWERADPLWAKLGVDDAIWRDAMGR